MATSNSLPNPGWLVLPALLLLALVWWFAGMPGAARQAEANTESACVNLPPTKAPPTNSGCDPRTSKNEPRFANPVNSPPANGSEAPPELPDVKHSFAPVEAIRWFPQNLSWDPAVSMAPNGAIPETSKYGLVEKYPDGADTTPVNMVRLDIRCVDAVTGAGIGDGVWAEVIDSTEKLRAAGTICFPGSFEVKHTENLTLLIRARTKTQVGYATIGYGAWAPSQAVGSTSYSWHGDNRVELMVTVEMFTRDQLEKYGSNIRVRDEQGNPVPGAMASAYERILGQAGIDGNIRIPPCSLRSDALTKKSVRIAVSKPGKVPVMIEPDDLTNGGVVDVVLRADEITIRFWLQLPPNTRVRPLDAYVHNSWDMRDRSILPEGVNYREAVKQMHWHSGRWGYGYNFASGIGPYNENLSALSAVTRTTIDFEDCKAYDRWYANQWKYDEQTGLWQVVIPHKGRFIITINEETRDVGGGRTERRMYPGLYLDATDPANPKVDLLYAP